MFIDILTVDGSPRRINEASVWGRGVGGAELALMTWAKEMVSRGHIVRIYNDPPAENADSNKVQFYNVHSFSPNDKRDVLITFRGPSKLAPGAYRNLHIGWSTDQYTEGDYIQWYQDVDKMVLISEFHKEDHLKRYPAAVFQIMEKGRIVDIGTDLACYETNPIEKVENQVIFCSVPDRGLQVLKDLWPSILAIKPELKLLITSDYTLWGFPVPNNEQHKLSFIGIPNVKFLGNVPRSELIKYQLQSEAQLYPCTYDENFCIANSECQVAGCFTVTSDIAALRTTNFTGVMVPMDGNFGKKFVETVINYFNLPVETRRSLEKEIAKTARKRFDIKRVCDQWENEILNV